MKSYFTDITLFHKDSLTHPFQTMWYILTVLKFKYAVQVLWSFKEFIANLSSRKSKSLRIMFNFKNITLVESSNY